MKRLFAFFFCVFFSLSVETVIAHEYPKISLMKPSFDHQEMPNKLTKKEKAEGWQLLYDGKTTKGWHVYRNKTDGSAWKSIDGTLTLDPSQKQNGKVIGGGDIVTDAVFDQFHFSIEWKVAPKANSGIIFLVQEDPKYEYPWHTGPEMQVLDNDGHPDGKIKSHRAGDLYDMIQCNEETVKEVGQWNKAEIRYVADQLELFLNGTLVVRTKMHDDQWKQMVAGSKFKHMPAFGLFRSGRIALQDHGDQIWFRNIKIKKL